jgi:Ni/Fe-hydrogenase subunit HybB-like protein
VPFIGVLYPVSRGRISPESYRPTVVEWGVSIGLIAATIFLFGLGARLMPVLPKEEVAAASKERAASASTTVTSGLSQNL